ncbi:pleiotropic drug resistance protein 3-like isoform X1 [Mercurialis annua]|uniref:pleiotropic drug resistance protein 3-like isoform X1 n=1 Tax=Mercurialis annua TaxID=3986 RepID=UPI00215EE126|nr:pleiotropic drug resistance protein 3-like isoform X1 [Mercurialis annua]
MAQLVGPDEIESFRIELAELGRSIRSSFRSTDHVSGLTSPEHGLDEEDDIDQLQWAAVERLPTFRRITTALFAEEPNASDAKAKRIVDVSTLGAQERHMFMEKLIKHIEHDNLRLLKKLRKRIHKAGVQLPSVEVRYKNLSVEAECKVVRGRPLPTLWNTAKTMVSELFNLVCSKQEAKISILKDVNGIIKPRRMTLLLGPPGCGKTTFLLALSGKLSHSSLQVKGDICYNGYKLQEFVPQKTSAYISQNDLHIPDMTVRETIDFSAQCQGIGTRAEIMKEVSRKEKQTGIVPDSDVDAYMKAVSIEGLKSNLQTDYILKILGLDFCADTMVGDAMRRGISGGQKKRLTTGEMIVGPTKALFMDEISNGLDSSTTFQIVSCLQHLVHITDATALISLLQPAPETFDLFDDVILMAEGKIVYHGPRLSICKFFEDCGFMCPERKGVADFLQEVISRKDQAQYWCRTDKTYSYVSVSQFVKKFNGSQLGLKLNEELSKPFAKSQIHKSALSFRKYSLPKVELFKACARREFLLMKRNVFIYVFKTVQLLIVAAITMTVLLRSTLSVDVLHANDYMGAIFYALNLLIVDGFPELQMTVTRLAVFHKQKELCFYPAWAYVIPTTILKIPVSFLEAFIWTSLTYYVIGFSPEAGRFFRQFLLLFLLHLTSISMFRLIASVCQTMVASTTIGNLFIMANFLFGGFIIPRPSMPAWLDWGMWIAPMTYGEIGLSVNEFLAPRWQKIASNNATIGQQTLESRGMNYNDYFYWISVGALIGFTVLFNICFILALTFLRPPGRSRAIISYEKYYQLQEKVDNSDNHADKDIIHIDPHPISSPEPKNGRMILPFESLTITFQDLQYYVDTPLEMRKRGFAQKKLQLLSDITGSFRPGILTALMGASGSGKTTLMDVLCGRKTGGTIEGDIRIGGYPKAQKTFARISGYVEQTDIHSPQITIEESLIYSAWLRLPSEIDPKTKSGFVNEVLETIELDGIKDLLVGLPGITGLSTEQRKRMTIAVELVSNPSIIFMDEPTTGLDARAAAIVMRAVKNVVETGRTVVCTIHQPSIDIFEAFDELVLLKMGGRIIYSGPLGQHSRRVIEYFENVPGVPKIKDNYNPATWMLEVTSKSAETELGVDFGQVYEESTSYKENKELVKQLSSPVPGSKELHFPTHYPQSGWEQFRACVWKHHLSYWRSPSYNLTRMVYMIAASIVFGALFWQQGQKINSQLDLFIMIGSMYTTIIFFGINNCSSVLPYVSTERTVLYREGFAGMYSPWAYAFAQVVVELPYLFTVAIIYVGITYPMIGYSMSAYKICWAFYGLLCNLLCFNYMGMLLVALTPNVQVASILASSTYTMLMLFAGYIVPGPRIPKWWKWSYYICPTSWVLNGMLTSQYGDVHKEILVFGETKTVSAFLQDYFGYHHDFLGVVAVVLIVFPFVFASLFAYSIGKLNFQRR